MLNSFLALFDYLLTSWLFCSSFLYHSLMLNYLTTGMLCFFLKKYIFQTPDLTSMLLGNSHSNSSLTQFIGSSEINWISSFHGALDPFVRRYLQYSTPDIICPFFDSHDFPPPKAYFTQTIPDGHVFPMHLKFAVYEVVWTSLVKSIIALPALNYPEPRMNFQIFNAEFLQSTHCRSHHRF